MCDAEIYMYSKTMQNPTLSRFKRTLETTKHYIIHKLK